MTRSSPLKVLGGVFLKVQVTLPPLDTRSIKQSQVSSLAVVSFLKSGCHLESNNSHLESTIFSCNLLSPFYISGTDMYLTRVCVCVCVCACVLGAQLCLTVFNPMDCSPPGSSVHGDSPGKNAGVGFHALLQGIFPTQGSNPGPPDCLLSEPPRKPQVLCTRYFLSFLPRPQNGIGSYYNYPYFTGKEARTEREKKSRTYKVTGKEAQDGFSARSAGTKA